MNMNFNLYFIYIAFIIILNISCKDRYSSVEHTFQVNYEMSILLDSVTAVQGIKSLQFLPEHEANTISFLNTFTQTLYVYECLSGKLNRTVTFQKEGPNGIGNATSAFYVNQDSILILNFNRKLFVLNSLGKKLHEIDMMPKMDVETQQFYDISQSLPCEMNFENFPIFRNGKLFLSGMMAEGWGHDISRAGTFITIDLENYNKEYTFTYPKIYKEEAWPTSFRFLFRTFNSNKQTFVYSFPADPLLYEVDLEGKLLASYPARGVSPTKINKWTYSEPVNTPNSKMKVEHYFNSNSFGFVLYDSINDNYYRLKYLPKKDLNLDHPRFDTNILVFDGSFNFIREVRIDANQEYGILEMAFISNQGGITTYRKQENEDLLELVTLRF